MKKSLVLFLSFSLLYAISASAQIIQTIAGNGSGGFAGDNGPATAAMLFNPGGLALDNNGDILIADMSNNCIRRIFHLTGIITTVPGSVGLDHPLGVSVDSLNNIYVTEWTLSVVRRITPTGVSSIIVGTGAAGYNGDNIPATTAQLNWPMDLVVDRNANQLYITDSQNNRIRKVDLSTGQIVTYAGTGNYGYNGDGIAATAADISQASALTIDSLSNLIILDKDNARIRKVDHATGLISTVMGTGAWGYSGNGGLATAATMSYQCYGVAVNGEGDVWFSDIDNNVIRRIDRATGIVTAVAGNATMGFSGDGGPSLLAQLNAPRGIVIVNSQKVTFSDESNNRVRQFNISSTTGLESVSNHQNLFQVAEINNSVSCFVGKANVQVACYDLQGRLINKATTSYNGIAAFDGSLISGNCYLFVEEQFGIAVRHVVLSGR